MPEGIIRHEEKATGRLCNRLRQRVPCRAQFSARGRDALFRYCAFCKSLRADDREHLVRMDTCGGDEHGTQIVRAAQFYVDAPPTWLAIHILPSLPSSMLAYGARRKIFRS